MVRVVDLESHAPFHCGFESLQGPGVGCEEAIQLAYRMSVILLRCPLVPEIMYGGASSTTESGKSLHNLYSVCAT